MARLDEPGFEEKKVWVETGSINLPVCRVPIGTHSDISENHRTAPADCTVLFISHPFGVRYRSPFELFFCEMADLWHSIRTDIQFLII